MQKRIFMQPPKPNIRVHISRGQSPRTPQEQEMVKREIESTDKSIDRLVYELYGLSEDEVKIVESK